MKWIQNPLNRYRQGDLWPKKRLPRDVREPVFLFLFTPPYSGSTALAMILKSAEGHVGLNRICEGNWLVPGLSQDDRGNPEKFVDWDSVRSVWLKKLSELEKEGGEVKLVVEKSPPNLVRAEQILKAFPKHEIMVFNRNPYANCSSMLHRRKGSELMPEDQRIALLAELASKWLRRAGHAKNIIDVHDPVAFTYEQFCEDVEATVNMAIERIPALAGINPHLEVKVKDYPPQKISDQNKRQISLLSEAELEAIAEILKDHEGLLNAFGYTSDWRRDIEQGGAGNPAPRNA